MKPIDKVREHAICPNCWRMDTHSADQPRAFMCLWYLMEAADERCTLDEWVGCEYYVCGLREMTAHIYASMQETLKRYMERN